MEALGERIYFDELLDELVFEIRTKVRNSIVLIVTSLFFLYINLSVVSWFLIGYAVIEFFTYKKVVYNKNNKTLRKDMYLFKIRLKSFFKTQINANTQIVISNNYELIADSISSKSIKDIIVKNDSFEFKIFSVRKSATLEILKKIIRERLEINIK